MEEKASQTSDLNRKFRGKMNEREGMEREGEGRKEKGRKRKEGNKGKGSPSVSHRFT